jgi:hypothetical protein
MKKIWLQYLSYAGLLGISLGLQILHPDLFALFCTPLPVGDSIDRRGGLELPLNSPILPPVERIK